MQFPSIRGIIRRRLLLNYRVEPNTLSKHIPSNFRPKLHQGYAIAGICLIKLDHIRPYVFPPFFSLSSENAAHRFAVEWEDDRGTINEGVFVPRRDTSSILNSLVGGRLFPGLHHLARFEVFDDQYRIEIAITPEHQDHSAIEIKASETNSFPQDSVFESLEASSSFFERGCLGYSRTSDPEKFDGLLLKIPEWKVCPLKVEYLQSSFFDNSVDFPEGTIQFDHALLMRDIPHEWHAQRAIHSEQGAAANP
jgi:hypothetical protein